MEYQHILCLVEDRVATITLHAPERRNALSPAMSAELQDALAAAAGDPEVRAIILTGAGGAFCAGGDIGSFTTMDLETSYRSMQGAKLLTDAFTSTEKPIIAAVNGPAFGAGFSLTLLSDIIIASDQAKFCMAFVQIGLIPDTGIHYFLPRLIGLQRAKELAMTGRTIGAEEACRIGLINSVVEAPALMDRARELALRLAAGPGFAIGAIKKMMELSLTMNLPQVLETEGMMQTVCFQTDDAAEAIDAFLHKRKPVFKGGRSHD